MTDHVRVHPGAADGTVRVPGDKSCSHRSLLLGALAGGTVPVVGLAPSGDVRSTAAALRRLGARIDLDADVDGALVGEVEGPLREPDDVLDCGNSGTALRLLAGVVAGIDGVSVLTGDASLRSRPVERVAEPLVAMGAGVSARAGDTRPPLVVRGGGLRGVRWEQPRASAQVKSCVLLAGLAADGPTTVVSPLVSRDHTERMLAHLGRPVDTTVDVDGREVVRVEPGPLVAAPLGAAGDPSSAAFWQVAAAVAGLRVATPGVSANPTRTGGLEVLRRMGAAVETTDRPHLAGEPVEDVVVDGRGGLAGGVRVDGRLVVDALDELPVLALAGAMSEGGLEVVDAAELRVKESDRIATTAALLRAVGIAVDERPDGYRVPGGQRPTGGRVEVHGDHRIAMTAAIAGMVGDGPVEITGFAAVATSYPSFLADLALLGGHADVLDAAAPRGDTRRDGAV